MINNIKVVNLPLSSIEKDPAQPRKKINLKSISELAESIKINGLINPITVLEKKQKEGGYLIVAGERRYLAFSYLGVSTIPCVILHNSNANTSFISLIENVQREDLSLIEQAVYLQKILDEYSISHNDLAKKIGKSRSYVTNILRLNNLSPVVKNLLLDKKIENTHARALSALSFSHQENLALMLVDSKITVRELEKKISRSKKKKLKSSMEKLDDLSLFITDLENKISDKISSKVSIKCNKSGKGSLSISFNDLSDFDRISSLLFNETK